MSDQFLKLFSDPAPALRVKFRLSDENASTIAVRHKLGSAPDTVGLDYLNSIGKHAELQGFRDFYLKHDGAELCSTHDARLGRESPLIELKPARNITAFSRTYEPGGRWAWSIDCNKSKALYRSSVPWVAFAEIDNGPACLTIFLEGENAGCVFLVAPQPAFNILRPIAKGFQPLLDRIAKDLPAFLRLVRATVSLRGKDGSNYGFQPVGYLANTHDCTVKMRGLHQGEIEPPRSV